MKKMEFFDANSFIGRPNNGMFGSVSSADQLLKELEKQGISKAIVWHIFQYEGSPREGNRILAGQIKGKENLYGCWTILPPQTQEIITGDFFKQMKENKIVCLNAFPDWHRFVMDAVAFGDFFDQISERSIPLFLTMGRSCISWDSLYRMMRDFPRLTCVLCDIGIWGVDRYTWPLLEKFENFYLESSQLSLEEGGVEATVKRFGSERIIFGTGFPVRYPKASILQLVHADISEQDKINIASKNLERILKKEKL
ncbi:MAG: amidohydrolase [Candidatus Omnitrophica bacterium]|nr:amidohydrolase [Candidatus Omnitrophota bacterium]